jgi:genome maintenance exonuclease 1
MIFEHKEIELPSFSRRMVDGIRYYQIPDLDEEIHMPSITSVVSNYKKEFFDEWRKKVGIEEANRITKESTDIGTDTHTLIEQYLRNMDCNSDVIPMSEMLFQNAVPTLDRINNIYALENSLYSRYLNIAGTVDCIAEFDGELSVIDFKTSKKPKPIEWIEGYFVQAVFYAMAFHEMTQLSPKKLVILMSCRDGQVTVYEERNLRKYMKLLTKYIQKFIKDKS